MMNPQQQYGMNTMNQNQGQINPMNQGSMSQDSQHQGNFMNQQQMMYQQGMSQNQQGMSQNQQGMSQNQQGNFMNQQNYQSQHYMNTPQGPDSQPQYGSIQQHLAPSPQVYSQPGSHLSQPSSHLNITQPSPHSQQQHSVGSFNVPPGSAPSIHPHTPQQQLGIPQRSSDGRFTSPQSITQKSPAANVMSNQPSQQVQSVSQTTPGAPQSIRQSHPTTLQPFPTDPLQANRILIIKELRRALHDVSQNAAYLLSLKFCSENRGPASVPNYQALSVGPASVSVNPSSNVQKEQRVPPTEEEIQMAKEKYMQSIQQFLAVTDNIDKNYATITQANREYQKYDSLSTVKVPNDLLQHPYVELIQPSLDAISEDSATIERVINELNELVQKVKAAENRTPNVL